MDSLRVEDFNLKHTIESGQIFRYEKIGDFYYVVAGDKIIKVKQEGNELLFDGVSEEFFENYFRLDDDYKKIINSIGEDERVRGTVEEYKGLRLMRQEPFECLVSFICSSVSAIPTIKQRLNNLAKAFGRPIELNGYDSHSFPEQIDHVDETKNLGLGFRAKYVDNAFKNIDRDWLVSLKNTSYGEAKQELMKLPGVGPKISDCVLLFSLDFSQAFPVDVWVKRVMEELYFEKQQTPDNKIVEFAQEHFGKNAGYAQQFLYHYRRLLNQPATSH